MISDKPIQYKSLIEITIARNRAIHSQLVLPPPLVIKVKGSTLLEYITVLPPELKRYIFQYIDIETRIQMLLQNRPYLLTGSMRPPNEELNANGKNPFYYLFNGYNTQKIMKQGWVKQFFVCDGTKWKANTEIKTICPPSQILTTNVLLNPNLRENRKLVTYNHPIVRIFDKFRKNNMKSHTSSVPIAALTLLIQTDSFDSNINYYLRNKGFKFIIAMSIFIDKIQKFQDKALELKKEILNRSEMGHEDRMSQSLNVRIRNERKVAAKVQAKRAKEQAKVQAKQAKVQAKQAKEQARVQAKQAKVQARVQAKQAKEQARVQAKQAKVQARVQAKQAKEQARVQAKQAKEQAKEQARVQAKQAKEQARVQAKRAKEQAKEQAKVQAKRAKEQAKVQAKQVNVQAK